MNDGEVRQVRLGSSSSGEVHVSDESQRWLAEISGKRRGWTVNQLGGGRPSPGSDVEPCDSGCRVSRSVDQMLLFPSDYVA
jgi:hypothetical protein